MSQLKVKPKATKNKGGPRVLEWSDTTMAFWAIIVAVVSIVIAGFGAVFSYWASEESNSIAKKALGYSEKFFVLENRPWIKLNLNKNEKTGQYYTSFEQDEKLIVEYKCDVENVGKQPAQEVSFEVTATNGSFEHSFIDETPALFDLAPGDKEPLIITTGLIGKDFESLEARLKAKIEKEGTILNITANYRGFDSTERYRSTKKYKIFGSNYNILTSESK